MLGDPAAPPEPSIPCFSPQMRGQKTTWAFSVPPYWNHQDLTGAGADRTVAAHVLGLWLTNARRVQLTHVAFPHPSSAVVEPTRLLIKTDPDTVRRAPDTRLHPALLCS